MLRVGFIGWRGMVGSVLMQRMREEDDFARIEPVFFSTSNTGGKAPAEAHGEPLKDALDLRDLASCDVLISCQGGEYTTEIYGPLRKTGWNGYRTRSCGLAAFQSPKRLDASFCVVSASKSPTTTNSPYDAP